MEILTLNLIGKGESNPFSLSRLLRELRGELGKISSYKKGLLINLQVQFA